MTDIEIVNAIKAEILTIYPAMEIIEGNWEYVKLLPACMVQITGAKADFDNNSLFSIPIIQIILFERAVKTDSNAAVSIGNAKLSKILNKIKNLKLNISINSNIENDRIIFNIGDAITSAISITVET